MNLRSSLRLASCSVVAALAIAPAMAWDKTGHQIIGVIAYTQLTPAEQERLNQILDAGDPSFQVPKNNPELGLGKAATFLDSVKSNRDTVYEELINELNDRFFPVQARQGRGREGTRLRAWHYKNKVIHLGESKNEVALNPVDAVKGLEFARHFFADSTSDREKAFAICVISHLVSDLGQPLHCVSSVRFSPKGDAGGNGFTLKLGRIKNLHSLWDGAITEASREWHGSTLQKAEQIVKRHPRSEFAALLADRDPDHWVDQGATLAELILYRRIERDATEEPETYRKIRLELALKQAALSGYRVADELKLLLK